MFDENSETTVENERDARVDLENFCRIGFSNDLAAAALVLGREESQLAEMLDGSMPVDEDLEMKVHSIAEEREIGL